MATETEKPRIRLVCGRWEKLVVDKTVGPILKSLPPRHFLSLEADGWKIHGTLRWAIKKKIE